MNPDKSKTYTAEECANACSKYKYFSVDNNKKCFCDDSLKNVKKNG